MKMAAVDIWCVKGENRRVRARNKNEAISKPAHQTNLQYYRTSAGPITPSQVNIAMAARLTRSMFTQNISFLHDDFLTPIHPLF